MSTYNTLRKALQLLQYIFSEVPRDAVVVMTDTALQHVAGLASEVAAEELSTAEAALDLLAQLATVRQVQPRLQVLNAACSVSQFCTCVLQGCEGVARALLEVEGAVKLEQHAGDALWTELGERVAAVRAALGCPPTLGGADVSGGGMQMIVADRKRP